MTKLQKKVKKKNHEERKILWGTEYTIKMSVLMFWCHVRIPIYRTWAITQHRSYDPIETKMISEHVDCTRKFEKTFNTVIINE